MEEHWAPLPKLWSFPVPVSVAYKGAVCFAFPDFFLEWIRFLSCKFARISFLPSCGSLDAVGLLYSFTSPVRYSLPCDPFLLVVL